MSNEILKKATTRIIKEYIHEELPHIIVPNCVLGRVTKVEDDKVNLKILDVNKNYDENYPELAEIKTDIACKIDDIVLLNFIMGELEYPVIIRKLG